MEQTKKVLLIGIPIILFFCVFFWLALRAPAAGWLGDIDTSLEGSYIYLVLFSGLGIVFSGMIVSYLYEKARGKTSLEAVGEVAVSNVKVSIVFYLIAAIFIGGLFFWAFGNINNIKNILNEEPSASYQSEPEVSQLQGWQTYRNDEYGFGISYPSNFKISSTRGTNISPSIESDKGAIDFSVSYRQPAQPLALWMDNVDATEWERLYVDNVEALKSPISGNMDGGSNYEILIPYEDRVFELNFSTTDKNTETVFSQILSTFHFFNKEAASGPEYVRIIFPSGGDKLILSNTYTIKWQSAGIDKINIDLVKGTGQFNLGAHIARDLPASLGEYSWKVEGVDPRDDYKIYIRAENGEIFDESDDYFEIISAS